MAEQELLFEGYLRKRRDKMKLKWVTYWFRLESTTLFFYSKKDSRAINLQGQYYLCTVESVREVNQAEGKRYVFEINMKNGKKKVLAAESEQLRQLWVKCLWKAMQSSGSTCVDSRPSWLSKLFTRQEAAALKKQQEEEDGVFPSSSNSNYGKGVLNNHGISLAFGQWDSPGFEQREPHTSEVTNCHVNWRSSRGQWDEREVEQEEDDYETLELRTEKEEVDDGEEEYYAVPLPRTAEISDAAPGEDIYDYPLSYRNSYGSRIQESREATESIYDIPRSLLRKVSEQSLEGQSSADNHSVVYEGMRGLRRDSLASWTAEVKEG